MDEQVKKRIFVAVDTKYIFNIFGYVNLKLLRSDAKIPEAISDEEIKEYLETLLD